MKTLHVNPLFILLIISSIITLSRCGQQDNTKKDEVKNDTIKKEMIISPVVSDSPATLIVKANKTDIGDNVQKEVKADPKKEITPAGKKNVQDPVKKTTVEQPVVIDKKQTPATILTPPAEKPVTRPAENPVVKVTDPIKLKPDTTPKIPDAIKPVTVVTPPTEKINWTIPAKYKNMVSPFPVDKESLDLGKSLYSVHCKSCHGNSGEGNGPKAAQINTKINSFLGAEFLAQSPGEIFYKTTYGHGDMPKFEKKIPEEEERWAVVNYIMKLKK